MTLLHFTLPLHRASVFPSLLYILFFSSLLQAFCGTDRSLPYCICKVAISICIIVCIHSAATGDFIKKKKRHFSSINYVSERKSSLFSVHETTLKLAIVLMLEWIIAVQSDRFAL